MVSPASATRGASALIIATWGALIGVLGGLIGLGGAEFRLPVLVSVLHHPLRRAVALNLTISLVTVLAAVMTRLTVLVDASSSLIEGMGVAIPMAAGGALGAYGGSAWVARVSDARLHQLIKFVLLAIGALLIAESILPWEPHGLPLGTITRPLVAVCAGLLIGVVSSMLGVAGGELIIPTLLFVFGIGIKSAGTLSLLVSVPTILMGIWRQHAHGVTASTEEVRRTVAPMGAGSIVGGVVGGLLAVYVPAAAVKLLLGIVLIGSALRVFAVEPDPSQSALKR